MTVKMNVFKCESCGNIVEVLHAGAGALVCCDKPMKLFVENTLEASKEKHVPVITRLPNGTKVTVGSVLHPMEEKHSIEWIELLVGDKVLRQQLKPGQEPVAIFEGVTADGAVAREYCNLHGLWKA
jgi:superoxide reductase